MKIPSALAPRPSTSEALGASVQAVPPCLGTEMAVGGDVGVDISDPIPGLLDLPLAIRLEAVATDDPGRLREDEFVPERAYEDALRDTYFTPDGARRVESSRTTPQRAIQIPLGAWMLEDFQGIHGQEINQLRVLDPSTLLVSEDTGPDKRDDVERYAEWIRQGLVPPPISVVETWEGNFKITNGHRRALAAKKAGALLHAWVSPTVTLPSGSRAGLTLELAREMVGPVYASVSVTSPEFKAWFRRSKVVTPDPEARPLVVYHGTRKSFEAFEGSVGPANPWLNGEDHHLGFFFSETSGRRSDSGPWGGAAGFAGTKQVNGETLAADGATIYPVFLAIQSPYRMTVAEYAQSAGRPHLKEELEALGYDGIQVENGTWVAFYPTQIKSTISNTGAFDPEDPRIIA